MRACRWRYPHLCMKKTNIHKARLTWQTWGFQDSLPPQRQLMSLQKLSESTFTEFWNPVKLMMTREMEKAPAFRLGSILPCLTFCKPQIPSNGENSSMQCWFRWARFSGSNKALFLRNVVYFDHLVKDCSRAWILFTQFCHYLEQGIFLGSFCLKHLKAQMLGTAAKSKT